MSSKRFLEEREHALEDEYFHRKDRELIARLREAGRRETERHDLEERLDTHDTAFLERLQAAGFAPDNLALLHLVPLVEVAWAEGEVTPQERALILALAARRGVSTDGPAYAQLVGWLDAKPDEAFFATTYEAIRMMLALEDEPSRHAAQLDLELWSTKIAEATGGILGMMPISKDERECLRRISERLSDPPPPAL